MKSNAQSTARLWVLLARDARVAAILRRGPSRQVQLIKWDLRTTHLNMASGSKDAL